MSSAIFSNPVPKITVKSALPMAQTLHRYFLILLAVGTEALHKLNEHVKKPVTIQHRAAYATQMRPIGQISVMFIFANRLK